MCSPGPKLDSDGPGPGPGEGHRNGEQEPPCAGPEDRLEGQAVVQTVQGRAVPGVGRGGGGGEGPCFFPWAKQRMAPWTSSHPGQGRPGARSGGKDGLLEPVASPRVEPQNQSLGRPQEHKTSADP